MISKPQKLLKESTNVEESCQGSVIKVRTSKTENELGRHGEAKSPKMLEQSIRRVEEALEENFVF